MMAILFVMSVPQLYRLETVPAWNTGHTSIQMLLSALISGGALAAVFGARRLGGWVSIAGIVTMMVTRPDYFGFLNNVEPELYSAQTNLWVFQTMAFLAGLFVLLATLFKQIDSRRLLASSACVIIFGELAGRVAFYNLWSIGM